MRKGGRGGASVLNLHPCSCLHYIYILTSSGSTTLLRLGGLSKGTMGTKMKGIYKGLKKNISQIFVVKEHEMQIGYPTDVKHVAHIGWDSQSSNAPSWMNEFKITSDFSSTSLNNLCDDPSWSSQEFEQSMRRRQQGSVQNSKDSSSTTTVTTTTTTTTTTEDLPSAPKQKRKKIKSTFSLKKSSSSSTSSRTSSSTKLQSKTSFATSSSMINDVESTVPVLASRSNKLGLL